MDVKTLKHIEAEAAQPMTVYTNRDIEGKLIEKWEKDANGEWQDVTAITKIEEEIRQAGKDCKLSEDFIEALIINTKRKYYDKFNT